MKTGILNRATSAKATNEQKTAEEELKLGVSALSIDYRKNTTNSQTFREFVTSNSGANLKTAMGLETTNADLVVENAENGIVSYKGQKYQVDDYGGVAEYLPMWIQNKTQVSKDGVTLEVGQAVSGYSVTANIGGTETTVNNWYVLGAKDGKLLLTTNTNPEQVTLSGKDGYTGGVAVLNSTAEKYTNSQFADGNARSINVDDINRVTGYDPDVAQYNAGTDNVYQWENEVTYTLDNENIYYKGTKYPIYEESQLGTKAPAVKHFEYWNESGWINLGEGTNTNSVTLTHTQYYYNPKTLTDSSGEIVGINTFDLAYILLFEHTGYTDYSQGYPPKQDKEKSYWLESKFLYCRDNCVLFGLRCVNDGSVGIGYLYYSYGKSANEELGLRPVVVLKSDVKVTKSGDTVSISI